PDFYENPGGAPANVAVALSRLGVDVDFVGKVGDDVLGRFLARKLDSEDVNIDNLVFTDEAKTAITFVTLDEDGDRSFDFYIDPSAD
ncbi:PfkB family carbohydrate kinase, partial [Escherichia coli]|uniref:PfkB family carbohydrate kinase n=1 Tax=Escherichia coli TaxID=562 RepID=UPI0017F2DC5E